MSDFASHCPRLVASGDAFGVSVPRALGNLVRAGDQLFVRFYIGNDTESMKTAGFHHDTCHIEVWRGSEANPKLIAVMPLDDRVYRDDMRAGGSMCDFLYRPERDGNAA